MLREDWKTLPHEYAAKDIASELLERLNQLSKGTQTVELTNIEKISQWAKTIQMEEMALT